MLACSQRQERRQKPALPYLGKSGHPGFWPSKLSWGSNRESWRPLLKTIRAQLCLRTGATKGSGKGGEGGKILGQKQANSKVQRKSGGLPPGDPTATP